MRRPCAHTLLCGMATTSVVLLAGCAPPAQPVEEGSERPLTSALEYAARSDQLAGQALQVVVRECMAAKGLDYQTSLPSVEPLPRVAIPFVGLTGQQDHADGDAGSARGDDGPDLTRAEREALLGTGESHEIIIDGQSTGSVPIDGCLAEGSATLSGGLDNYKAERTMVRRIYQGLHEAGVQAADAPEVRQATSAWTSCMAEKGFTYDNPSEVAQAMTPGVALQSWPDAVADLECKESVDFVVIAEHAMGAAERHYAQQHPGLVTGWKDLMDARYERVRAVLSGEPR